MGQKLLVIFVHVSIFGPTHMARRRIRVRCQRKTAEPPGTSLIRPTYIYLTEGSYPADATFNDKRAIRHKASKFMLRNGELLYKKSARGVDG